jgi:putative endonuclease
MSAEAAARAYVEALGMSIIDTNLRVGTLELDIVARDGATIVVIEVRTRGRTAWERAAESVSRSKQERLRRAASLLWARRFCRWHGVETMRFDVACVDLDGDAAPRVEYFRAAFV